MNHTVNINRIITQVSSLAERQTIPEKYDKPDMWDDLQALAEEVIRLRRIEKNLNAAIRIKDQRNELLRVNLQRFTSPGTDADLIIKQSERHYEATNKNH